MTQNARPRVLARTRQEAMDYFRSTEESFSPSDFLSNPVDMLRGLRGQTVVCVGSWKERSDLAEIEEIARAMEVTFVDRSI